VIIQISTAVEKYSFAKPKLFSLFLSKHSVRCKVIENTDGSVPARRINAAPSAPAPSRDHLLTCSKALFAMLDTPNPRV
jgi:hypothetical protein